MRTLTFSLLFFLALTGLQAQTLEEDYATVSEFCCNCMDKKMAADENINMEMALGLCMVGAVSADPDMSNRIGLDFANPASMEGIGEQVGMRMLTTCPTVMLKLIEESGAMEKASSTVAHGPCRSCLAGGQNRVGAGRALATALTVITTGGDRLNLVWLTSFPGDEALIENWGKLKGKQVRIDYREEMVFSSSLRQYVKRRVITGAALE